MDSREKIHCRDCKYWKRLGAVRGRCELITDGSHGELALVMLIPDPPGERMPNDPPLNATAYLQTSADFGCLLGEVI